MAITIKNEEQIAKMRIAGQVLAKGLKKLKSMIKPGTNVLDLDRAFAEHIAANDCESNFKGYGGFPATICVSINEQLIHGIPVDRVIKEGDLVSVDAGCIYQGWHVDSAFTVICGSPLDEKYDILVNATEKSLYLAIEQIRAGVRVGTLSSAVQNYIEDLGFHLPVEFSGHGIGRAMHEDPFIPNVGIPNTGTRLQKGMTICIEPMVQIGTRKIVIADDDWTVSSADGSMTAHFEHTILVTEDGYEILTLENKN
jgi:methionyl aminopeptidase